LKPRDKGAGYAPKNYPCIKRGAVGYTTGLARRPTGSSYRDFSISPRHPFVGRIQQKDIV